MLRAAKINNVIKRGSSVPIIASDEQGNEFFVKAKGAGDGLTALIADWIVTSVGHKLGLPILKPEIIIIDEETLNNYPHEEVSDLIKRSYGANLAYKYFPDAQIYNALSPHPDFDRDIKDLIFLFDSFFVNIDRTKDNPNIFNSKNNIYAVDFGASFLIKEIFDNIPYCRNVEIQKLLKRNIFYNESADVSLMLDRLGSMTKEQVSEIIDAFPDEWIAGSRVTKNELSGKLFILLNKENHLTEALEVLKKIELPSDEEIRMKKAANKKKFEEKAFGDVLPLMPPSKRY